LFFAAPIEGIRAWHDKTILGTDGIIGEVLVTVLCLVHIFEFYPPIFMVLSQNTFEMRETAGRWLNAWGWINIACFIPYMVYAVKGLRGAHRQEENAPLNQ